MQPTTPPDQENDMRRNPHLTDTPTPGPWNTPQAKSYVPQPLRDGEKLTELQQLERRTALMQFQLDKMRADIESTRRPTTSKARNLAGLAAVLADSLSKALIELAEELDQ